MVSEPWERLLDILAVVGARCDWQGDKAGQRLVPPLGLLCVRVEMWGGRWLSG